MELSDIRALRTLVEEGSLRAAAIRLNESPGAVNNHIRRLEGEVGTDLLVRTSRQSVLTPAGATLLDATLGLQQAADQAVIDARQTAIAGIRRLHIGHNGVSGLALLRRALPALRDHPGPIQFGIHEAPNSALHDMLLGHQLDLAILRPPVDEERISHRRLLDEQLVAVVAAKHPLADKTSIVMADLADEAFAFPPRDQTLRAHDLMIEACQEHGNFKPTIIQEASSIASFLVLVASGTAVALLPSRWQTFYRNTGLQTLKLETPLPSLPVHLAWNKHDVNPVVQAAREAITAAAAMTSRPR